MSFRLFVTLAKFFRSKSAAQEMHLARTSALGEMAGQAAHEINTPLGAIVLSIELIQQKAADGPLDKEFLDRKVDLILKVTDKISRITSAMRKLAGTGAEEPRTTVRVSEIVEIVTLLCEGRFKKHGILFSVDTSAMPSQLLHCRIGEISLALIDLLNQAHDAVVDLEEKRVRLLVREFDSKIRFDVISDRVDPMTKSNLSLCQNIAAFHQGRAFLDSANKNICFVLELPCQQSANPKLMKSA